MSAPASLGWAGVLRLGLVQTALGAIVLIVTSSINRIMVVELALPAIVPGCLVALHYAVQMLRPRLGHGADRGGRRTPWIIGGMAVLAVGGVIAALATAWMSVNLWAGLALAVLGFLLVGLGVGASGTSLLLLLAATVAPARRPAAATLVWLMMLFGFAVTATFIAWQLTPFTPARLVEVTLMVSGFAFVMTVAAVWGIERNAASTVETSAAPDFRAALKNVWAEPQARRFTLFVFAAMFAYSAQELVLEPFAGMVFARSPAESARLAGLLHGGVFSGMLLAAIGGSLFGRGRPEALLAWAVGGCTASALMSAALAASSLVGPAWPLNANVFLLGLANGSFVTAAIGSMMALAAQGEPGHAGVRMGLWGAAQAIAFALGGLAGSSASDLARAAFGTPVPAYAAVFLGQAALFLAAARQASHVFSISAKPRLRAGGVAQQFATGNHKPEVNVMDWTDICAEMYDVVIVGGGPSGATATTELAKRGRSVLLLDRAGRIKPCGGAIPPALIRGFDIPDSLLKARVTAARMISPKNVEVDMPIDGGFVGMVDRESFDAFLRDRAVAAGAELRAANFESFSRDADGVARVHFRPRDSGPDAPLESVRARAVIGADGAKSGVAKACMPKGSKVPYVFAYHEIVKTPTDPGFDGKRCDVYYQGKLSPDFYGWVFPHGETTSVGSGTARKGFSLRGSVGDLRAAAGLAGVETIRREGAPIPLRPLKRWDNGRDVVLAGDAAGVVAPASGEGIYYAMVCGQMAGEAVEQLCATGDVKALKSARRRFMKAHGRVFWVLGIMQWFWYSSDKRREKFVSICRDPDVQHLTWEAYMNKKLVRAKPVAHVRIFFKDLAHLIGLRPA